MTQDYNARLMDKGTDFIKSMQEDELKILNDMIEEIDSEIEKRKQVSKTTINNLDKTINEISNLIMNMPKLESTLENSNVSGEIVKAVNELRLKKIQIEELKNQETINLWRDTANLKREQRLLIREFKEKEKKGNILDDLIGE